MKIQVIDAANPLGVSSLREIWQDGPVGYSEPHLVMANALANRGHEVTIYGQTREPKQVIPGVTAEPILNYVRSGADATLYFIGRSSQADWAPFRLPDIELIEIAKSLTGPVLAFGYKPLVPAPSRWPTKQWGYLALSRWHHEFMAKEGIPANSIINMGLPIHPDNDFDPDLAAKRPFLPRVLYASSWDRGLESLLTMWPQIRERVPEAELFITYNSHKGKLVEELKQQNVFILGNLSFRKMKELYHSCHVLAYPCDDDVETFCYTVRKAQMAGCVPVVTPTGALPEAVLDSGGIVSTPDKFVKALLSLIQFRPFWESRTHKCREIDVTYPDEYAAKLEKAWVDVSAPSSQFSRLFK